MLYSVACFWCYLVQDRDKPLMWLTRPFSRRLLSASGVTEARDGGFGYDDGFRRSTVVGEHEGFLSSWPQWTQSTSHPCSTTRSASPWCASTAGQRPSVALDGQRPRGPGRGR